jgi:hypothetical protein
MARQVLVACQCIILISISRVESADVAAGQKLRAHARIIHTPFYHSAGTPHRALAHLNSTCSHQSAQEGDVPMSIEALFPREK